MEKTPPDLGLILKYFSDFTPRQVEQLGALPELYNDWNSKINVISRKDLHGLYEKHVLHSLSIAALGEFKPGTEVIDIGTGGGFPGIPLAIFFPEVHFHLADSIGKKLKVVKEVSDAIGLTNISTRHTRVEEIRDRKFDYAVSRAVAPLHDLWQWSKPLLRKNPALKHTDVAGSSAQAFIPQGLICLKGGDLAQEISESGTQPVQVDIAEFFGEDFFKEKYIVVVRLS